MTNAAPNPPRIANAPDTSLAIVPAPVFGAAVGLALELEPALALPTDAADVMALLARKKRERRGRLLQYFVSLRLLV